MDIDTTQATGVLDSAIDTVDGGQEDEGTSTSISQEQGSWGPMQWLADAVLTQAFHDLQAPSGPTPKAKQKAFDSARIFLLGESPEARKSLHSYCDALSLDPLYIHRMARGVIAKHAA